MRKVHERRKMPAGRGVRDDGAVSPPKPSNPRMYNITTRELYYVMLHTRSRPLHFASNACVCDALKYTDTLTCAERSFRPRPVQKNARLRLRLDGDVPQGGGLTFQVVLGVERSKHIILSVPQVRHVQWRASLCFCAR